MKFYVDSQEFKNAIEKVAVICPKKPAIPQLGYVEINADSFSNTITFNTCNGDEMITLCVAGTVVDPGNIQVDYADAKKLYRVNGDEICVETAGNTLKVHDNKRQSAIPTHEPIDRPSVSGFKSDVEFIIEAGNLLEIMKNVGKCLSTESFSSLAKGYNFTSDKIQALDSHRVGIRYMTEKDWEVDPQLNIVVPGQSYKALKTLVGKDTAVEIAAFSNGRWIKFDSDSWTYEAKLLEGNYWDTSKMIGKMDYSFNVDSGELHKISKEYAQISKGSLKPMVMHFKGDSLSTVLLLPDFQTSDFVEITDAFLPEEMNIGFNPEYVRDITEVFDGTVKISFLNKNNQVYISQGEYLFFILPVNMNVAGTDEKIRDFLKTQR